MSFDKTFALIPKLWLLWPWPWPQTFQPASFVVFWQLSFTSPNYPKCKLICTSGNLNLQKIVPSTSRYRDSTVYRFNNLLQSFWDHSFLNKKSKIGLCNIFKSRHHHHFIYCELWQNVCVDVILDVFGSGSCGVRNYILKLLSPAIMKLCQNWKLSCLNMNDVGYKN